MDKTWKIICMIVYLIICVLDFIVIPGYILILSDRITSFEYFKGVKEIFIDNPEVMNLILADRNPGNWTPFTLRSGGVLHIAFGAILTGSIIGRNGKKKE